MKYFCSLFDGGIKSLDQTKPEFLFCDWLRSSWLLPGHCTKAFLLGSVSSLNLKNDQI